MITYRNLYGARKSHDSPGNEQRNEINKTDQNAFEK